MKIAIQKSQKGWYIPPMNGKYNKPDIRYYEADSIEDAKHMEIMEYGFEWNYTVASLVYNVGDYIGDYDDVCYKVVDIQEDSMTLERVCTGNTEVVFIDYERFHMLRRKDHPDIEKYPINSEWKLLTNTKICGNAVGVVKIRDYAISSGVFWVVDINVSCIGFIARKDELGERLL